MQINDGWSDTPPINLDEIDDNPKSLKCPECGADIEHTPTHDESDGVQTYAVPDEFWCAESCGYRYAE